MQKNRLAHIDMFKGFVILCVVLGHVVEGFISSNAWPEHTKPLYAVFNAIYSFHMAACFIISGFLFRLAYVNPDGSIKKKRIYAHSLDFAVLYVLFCVLLWAFKLIFSGSVNSGVEFTDILLIWYKPMPGYWYLYVLISLYLIFSIERLRKTDSRIVLCVLFVISALSGFVPYFGLEINHIIYFAFFFYCGMVRRQKDSFVLFRRPAGVILSVVGIVLCFVFVSRGIELYTTPVLNSVAALGISIMFWNLFEHLDLRKSGSAILSGICRVFETIGKYMLEIYVTHCFVAAAVRIVFIKVGISNILLCVAVDFVLSAGAPILLSLILKKLGVHGFVFRTVSTIKALKAKE